MISTQFTSMQSMPVIKTNKPVFSGQYVTLETDPLMDSLMFYYHQLDAKETQFDNYQTALTTTFNANFDDFKGTLYFTQRNNYDTLIFVEDGTRNKIDVKYEDGEYYIKNIRGRRDMASVFTHRKLEILFKEIRKKTEHFKSSTNVQLPKEEAATVNKDAFIGFINNLLGTTATPPKVEKPQQDGPTPKQKALKLFADNDAEFKTQVATGKVTRKQITAAYRRIAKKLHPDSSEKNGAEPTLIKDINDAYALLSNKPKQDFINDDDSKK